MSGVVGQAKKPLAFRVTPAVFEALEARRVELGMSRTLLVEDLLRQGLDLPALEQGPEAGRGGARGPVQAPPRALADLVAERAGLPAVLAARFVQRGSVQVDGRPWTDPSADVSAIPDVALVVNGEVV